MRYAVHRCQLKEPNPVHIRYDPDLSMTIVETEAGPVPVVELPNYAGARTKKDDIEKGEDQKDQNPPRPQKPQPSDPKPKPK